MLPASLDEIGDCDLILSVVPPDAALQVARTLAPALGPGRPRLGYIECNAIAPATAVEIAGLLQARGVQVIDGGIVGGPPGAGGTSPIMFVSGPQAEAALALSAYGIDVRPLGAPIGSASALKISLAAVSKGLTGVFCLAGLAAADADVLEPFLQQLAASQPGVLAWGERQVPALPAKAGRWVQEMQILGELTRDLAGGPQLYAGLEALYAAIAANPSAVEALALRLSDRS